MSERSRRRPRGLATVLRLPLDPVLQLQDLPIEAAATASSEASIKCEGASDQRLLSANEQRAAGADVDGEVETLRKQVFDLRHTSKQEFSPPS